MKVVALAGVLMLVSCTETSILSRNCSDLKYDDFGPYCVAVISKKTWTSTHSCEISIVKSRDDSDTGYGNYLPSPIDDCSNSPYSFTWDEGGLRITSGPSEKIEVAIRVPKSYFTGGR